MPLIQVVAILIAAVIFLWLVNRNRPVADRTRSILNVVVVIAVILWLLGIFGILNDIANIHIGR